MNANKVFKLDLLSIRPYLTLKNLIILIGLSVIYAALSKNPVTVITITQMFALLFSGYPFMVGEEAGIDPLYKIFSIESKDVVKGRYLVSTLFVGLMLIAGIILSLIISCLYSIVGIYKLLLLVVPITFLVTTLIIFMEYPIYFKYGYLKGKTLASIPFLLIGIVVLFSTFFANPMKMILNLFIMNKVIGIGILFVIWVITLMVSYKLSNRFYSKRDF